MFFFFINEQKDENESRTLMFNESNKCVEHNCTYIGWKTRWTHQGITCTRGVAERLSKVHPSPISKQKLGAQAINSAELLVISIIETEREREREKTRFAARGINPHTAYGNSGNPKTLCVYTHVYRSLFASYCTVHSIQINYRRSPTKKKKIHIHAHILFLFTTHIPNTPSHV